MELVPGTYEHLVTERLGQDLTAVRPDLVELRRLDRADADVVLSRHIAALARRALRQVGTGDDGLQKQLALANTIATAIAEAEPRAADTGDFARAAGDLLLGITKVTPIGTAPTAHRERPQTPLTMSALLVNGHGQPNIGGEVKSELASADGVDLLCAFIKWVGLRIVLPKLQEALDRGVPVRVLTTTYIGATERRALDELVCLGAEVRISYDTRTTRLHAKAWLFRRDSGLDTAYVGSSNLSRAALLDGLEWNVRLSAAEQPQLIDTFAGTFDSYWADPGFEPYDPERDGDRLDRSLAQERGVGAGPLLPIAMLDVRPFPYQQEVLDSLAGERMHDRWHSLVVMATGTGKTVVSALDFQRLRQEGTVKTLLFVAHRREILDQSRSMFRQVLRQADVGEMFVGGQVPRDWQVVFASVQSLSRAALPDPTHFDMVIVDEFHHAEASTYTRLLDHLQPKVLVGLTATPERTDGLDIRRWFGGRTAVELRLWEALDRGGVLSPFQYFGIHDDVSLDRLAWKRGGYDQAQLSGLYTGNDARVRVILQAVRDKVADPGRMRALGFCVSVAHAEFMAQRFTEAGLPSRAITSRTADAERADALGALGRREVAVLFTVDLFNEGIDLPTIDTVLFLRPTESATVFLQQMGRGLRLSAEKDCLTVLDFVGSQNAEFRFDLRYRAMTGLSRRDLPREVEADFPTLPSGCHIELDRVAKEVVLANVRASLRVSKAVLARELRELGECTLGEFLDGTGVELEDVYRRPWGGWTGLRRAAGLETSVEDPEDKRVGGALGRLLHVDDPARLDRLDLVAAGEPLPVDRLARMVAAGVWSVGGASAGGPTRDPVAAVAGRYLSAARRRELAELSRVLRERIHRVPPPLTVAPRQPLQVHARYTRTEALLAFGMADPGSFREGVKWFADEHADVFFVTLRKTEDHYSPTTMYADRAISPTVFQWESQSTTSKASPTGQRYVHHRERGSTVHLFVRETNVADGALGAPPFLYAGTMRYFGHTGDRPMRITWHLDYPLPADVYQVAGVATA